ncbi:hypothetical protein BX265_0931 [Streptomyces sp. TLI_235]|nr:hypothetical protein BX265_0931 [Streptomyces sp. TLI_235]
MLPDGVPPDPADANPLIWTALALRQGRTELARAALIRLLDDAGPRDAVLLDGLAAQFGRIGDHRQAARARHLFAALQDDPSERAAALADLAAHRRRAGDPVEAGRALRQAAALLTHVPSAPPGGGASANALFVPEQSHRPRPDPGALRAVADQCFRLAEARAAAAGVDPTGDVYAVLAGTLLDAPADAGTERHSDGEAAGAPAGPG